MRNLFFVNVNDGPRRVNWSTTIGFVVVLYAAVIGAAEVFWKMFAGGYSTLIGLYALFTATLILVRVIGSVFVDPISCSGSARRPRARESRSGCTAEPRRSSPHSSTCSGDGFLA